MLEQEAIQHLDETFQMKKNERFHVENHIDPQSPICIYGAGNWGGKLFAYSQKIRH